MQFTDQLGEVIEAIHLIPRCSLIFLSDGRVCQVRNNDLGTAGDLGPIRMDLEEDAFNEQNISPLSSSAFYQYRINGRKRKLHSLKPAQACIELDLSAMENVAGEWEAFELDIFLNLDGQRAELYELQSRFLGSILHVYGGKLLSAKRRVRALCDLLRRVLSSDPQVIDPDLSIYASDYPELFDVN